MTNISFDIAHYGETTADLRAKGVSFENKSDDWGRESLCGLFSDKMTIGDMDATLVAILKPKKANGKPATTRSSLRNVKGGDAVRKVADSIEAIYEAATKGSVATEFRPLAIAFATNAPNAPKSLNALKSELSKLRAAATKEAKEAADNATTDSEPEGEQEAAQTPLSVIVERATLAIAEASDDDILAADEALSSLMETIRARYDAVADSEEATGTNG